MLFNIFDWLHSKVPGPRDAENGLLSCSGPLASTNSRETFCNQPPRIASRERRPDTAVHTEFDLSLCLHGN